jgi:hypothetical protein
MISKNTSLQEEARQRKKEKKKEKKKLSLQAAYIIQKRGYQHAKTKFNHDIFHQI